jgi:hypothetical protein
MLVRHALYSSVCTLQGSIAHASGLLSALYAQGTLTRRCTLVNTHTVYVCTYYIHIYVYIQEDAQEHSRLPTALIVDYRLQGSGMKSRKLQLPPARSSRAQQTAAAALTSAATSETTSAAAALVPPLPSLQPLALTPFRAFEASSDRQSAPVAKLILALSGFVPWSKGHSTFFDRPASSATTGSNSNSTASSSATAISTAIASATQPRHAVARTQQSASSGMMHETTAGDSVNSAANADASTTATAAAEVTYVKCLECLSLLQEGAELETHSCARLRPMRGCYDNSSNSKGSSSNSSSTAKRRLESQQADQFVYSVSNDEHESTAVAAAASAREFVHHERAAVSTAVARSSQQQQQHAAAQAVDTALLQKVLSHQGPVKLSGLLPLLHDTAAVKAFVSSRGMLQDAERVFGRLSQPAHQGAASSASMDVDSNCGSGSEDSTIAVLHRDKRARAQAWQ